MQQLLDDDSESAADAPLVLPPAPPPVDPIEALKAQQEDVNKKKAMLGVLGNVFQGISDRPSGYELYTGNKSARPNMKGMFDAAASGVEDPFTAQQKAAAYLKSKNEATQAIGQNKFRTSLGDDTSDAAKAFKMAAGVPAGMTALEALDQGYSPAEIGKIKAKESADLEKERIIHSMDAAERAKDRALDRGLKRQEMDAALFKTQGQTDPNKAAALIQQAGPNADPATLVKFLVPEHHQQKAYDEIDAAQNTARNAPGILKAFDNAANNLHAADFVPGASNADQKALHALMGPTFKDVEGTVRQAAMDNMNNNTTPQFGDSKATLQKKRDALVGYLKSKSAAPIVAGYNMPLSKFPSTTFNDGDSNAPPMDPLRAAAAKEIERRKKSAAANDPQGDGG